MERAKGLKRRKAANPFLFSYEVWKEQKGVEEEKEGR